MSRFKFGTDGWRAIIAKDFTLANCQFVVQGIASYVKQKSLSKKGIVVAYDNRFLAEDFAREACKVLVGNGIKTYLMKKTVPTPLAAFAVKNLVAGGAVVLTASHNPAEYLGIKFLPYYAGPALPDVSMAIEFETEKVLECGKTYELSLNEAEQLGIFSTIDFDSEYIASLLQVINVEVFKNRKLKVLVDPMFGSGIGYLEKILQQLGCEVRAINNYRDPLFGGIVPEPIGEQLCDLKRAVQSYNADIGLALDGDADRFGIIDKEGNHVNANIFLALILKYLLNTRSYKGPICRSMGTTHLLDRIAEKHNLQLIETPVGFKYVSAVMREKGCMLGCEESGGLTIMGHIPEKDGILAGLLAVEMLASTGKTFAELTDEVIAQYGSLYSKRFDISINDEDIIRFKSKINDYCPKNIAGTKVISSTNEDGLRIILDDNSWILIRFSGTEPLVRVYIESINEEKVDEYKNIIQKEVFAKLN